MGDRCYCTVRCLRSDLERVMPDWRESLSHNMDDERNGVLRLGFEEVNYADVFGCEGFPDSIPCIVENSAGCEYEAGVTVRRINGEFENRDGSLNGAFLFPVDPKTGLPIVTPEWIDFWAAYQEVLKYLNEVPQEDES